MSPSAFLVSTAFICLFAAASGPVQAQESRFSDPTHGGYPISNCGINRTNCGGSVATAWCRSQNYDVASEWSIVPDPVVELPVAPPVAG